MSRAVNLTATPEAVKALCLRHNANISTLEALPAGGCRVVLVTMADADMIRLKMKDKIISGTVVRSGQFHARTAQLRHR